MGPLEMLYGWEAMLCAIACIGISQLVKTILEVTVDKPWPIWVKRLVLPMTPILVGALYAMAVPFLPPPILEWFAENGDIPLWRELLGAAAWGAACGQFANYLYDRVKKLMVDVRERPAS